jgi:hypothetical protein
MANILVNAPHEGVAPKTKLLKSPHNLPVNEKVVAKLDSSNIVLQPTDPLGNPLEQGGYNHYYVMKLHPIDSSSTDGLELAKQVRLESNGFRGRHPEYPISIVVNRGGQETHLMAQYRSDVHLTDQQVHALTRAQQSGQR